MYVELENNNLICINNSDIVIELNDNYEYRILKKNPLISYQELGKYDTQEKAIKVINEIKISIINEEKIFKMPTQEEVTRWLE